MEKLNELVDLAKKATPGKWWIDSHGHSMVAFSGEAGDVEIVFATDNDMGPLVRHCDTGNLSHWRNDNDATFIAAANPTAILAIAEAFRDMEHKLKRETENHMEVTFSEARWKRRAEAAEAKLAELEKQEPVAYRWEGKESGNICYDGMKPLGVISQPLFTSPAPAADLAELVPVVTRLKRRYVCNEGRESEFIACVTPERSSIGTGQVWDDWRELFAILRNIEEAE